MSSDVSIGEPEAFLAAHPDTGEIELLLPDNNGVIRGKRLAADGLVKLYRDGVRLPESIFALDITGDDVVEAGLLWEQGVADRVCRPVPGTLCPVPWHRRPMAQALLTMHNDDGSPFFAEPRQVLARVLERFAGAGLTPVVAVELEFYLIDRERSPDGRLLAPISPLTGLRQKGIQSQSLAALEEFDDFFAEVTTAAAIQGLPVEGAVSEAAPGQYEVNLNHVGDALAAADHGVLLKRLVRGVAGRAGFEATFMAKPFANTAGNGLHLHVSLLDGDGRNIFDDGGERGTDALRHAIGGLAATMTESMAIMAPNANSFRRFQTGGFTPAAPSWGYNNRTVALRVPGGEARARRIEHRVAGADANVYLVAAAVLAGIHHGIVGRIDPGPPIAGNSHDGTERTLPDSWADALRAFDAARILPDYLGLEFCRVHSACRWAERRKFEAAVSPLEYEWYLRTI
jgi:glutamine synthetase